MACSQPRIVCSVAFRSVVARVEFVASVERLRVAWLHRVVKTNESLLSIAYRLTTGRITAEVLKCVVAHNHARNRLRRQRCEIACFASGYFWSHACRCAG